MPNRILKESICTSDTINDLSLFEEVFFYRLIVICDDYGRSDARPAILKSKMFPLRDVRNEQIKAALNALSLAGLALLYEVDGKPFVQLTGWADHQRVRNARRKCPDPPQVSSNSQQLAASCGEMPQNAASGGLNPNPNPNPESESESEAESVSERAREDHHDGPILSESEMTTLGQKHTGDMQAIEARARQMGMAWALADEIKANALIADYSAKWLMDAMGRAAGGQASCRSWRYIEAILKAWKTNGGPDHDSKPFQHVGKRVTEQGYAQRQYGEIDMNKWAAQMIAESAQKEPAAQ